MKKKLNKKGFTLAELLIVIAIIAILIAIAIPVFTNALNSARRSTDDANIRAAYAQYTVDQMANAGFNGTIANMSDAETTTYVEEFIGGPGLQFYASVAVDTTTGRWSGVE